MEGGSAGLGGKMIKHIHIHFRQHDQTLKYSLVKRGNLNDNPI